MINVPDPFTLSVVCMTTDAMPSIPAVDAKRLLAALQAVASSHPARQSFVTELVGQPGAWRARKGDYRAVYAIVDGTMTVIAVGHRKDIYE